MAEPRMPLAEAIAEARRWFAYLDREREKTAALVKLAGQRRRGEIDEQEARRQMHRLCPPGHTVYSGEELERAVRTMVAKLEKEVHNG